MVTTPKDELGIDAVRRDVAEARRLAGEAAMLAGTSEAMRRSVDDLRGAVEALSDLYRLDATTREERLQAFGREQVVKRRRSVVLGVLLIVVFAFVTDYHVEACAPGNRVEEVLDVILDPAYLEISSDERARVLRDAARVSTPGPVCDLVQPLHAHAPRGVWPSPWHAGGLVAYSVVLVALGVWSRRAGHRPVTVAAAPPPAATDPEEGT